MNGTSKAIQEKIEERRRKKLLAGPYEKTSSHDQRSATVTRPDWTPTEEKPAVPAQKANDTGHRSDNGGLAAGGDTGPPREDSTKIMAAEVCGEKSAAHRTSLPDRYPSGASGRNHAAETS